MAWGVACFLFITLYTTIYSCREEEYLSKGSFYTKLEVTRAYIRKMKINIHYEYVYQGNLIESSTSIGAQDFDQGFGADRSDIERVKKLELLVEFSSITPDYHRIRWDLVCELDKCFNDSTVNVWDSIPEGWVKGKY